MRTLIFNADIITGDGKTVLENRSIALEGGLIDKIINVRYPNHYRADRVIDASGGFVIPGIINHHTHAITTGPSICGNALPALSKSRVEQNLSQHLLEGETTIGNADGFANMEEVAEARGHTPMLVQTMSLHMPLQLESAKRLNLGGLKEKHLLTVEDVIKQGAFGIGEIGGTADVNYFDIFYIPIAVNQETGVQISIVEARTLRQLLTDQRNEKTASDLMAKKGISAAMEHVKQLVGQSRQHVELAIEADKEAAKMADNLGVPLIMHNSGQTKSLVLNLAKELKGLFVASHCNYSYEPQEAIEVARAIKKAGGWVDISTGDFFRARQICRNHATTLALLEEQLIDMISTDYAGGYWDPILRVLEYAVAQNVIELPQAIALATGNVPKAIPNIAPNRGQIAEGKIADLAIISQKSIAEVRTVIIGGRVVVEEMRLMPRRASE